MGCGIIDGDGVGDASVPSQPVIHPRPYGQGDTFFTRYGRFCWNDLPAFPAALRPPADDAAQEHEDAAEPDEGDERVDEDADGGLREAVPTGKEDVEVGQVISGDRDFAGRMVVKIRIELARG